MGRKQKAIAKAHVLANQSPIGKLGQTAYWEVLLAQEALEAGVQSESTDSGLIAGQLCQTYEEYKQTPKQTPKAVARRWPRAKHQRRTISPWETPEKALECAERLAKAVPVSDLLVSGNCETREDVTQDIILEWLRVSPTSKGIAIGIARNVVRAYWRQCLYSRRTDAKASPQAVRFVSGDRVLEGEEGEGLCLWDTLADQRESQREVLRVLGRTSLEGITRGLHLPKKANVCASKVLIGHYSRVTTGEARALTMFARKWLTRHPAMSRLWGVMPSDITSTRYLKPRRKRKAKA